MSVNPFPFTQTRDFAATSPLELGSSGTRAVSSAMGSKRVGDDSEPEGSRRRREGASQGRPREEREHDAQRQALARVILGAFDVNSDARPADTPDRAVADQHGAGPEAPHAVSRDPRLEAAILEFMYSLFHALDQIDDAEPTIEFVTRPMAIGPGSGRTGRNAFGERLDLLVRDIAVDPGNAWLKSTESLPGFEGIEPRLALSYSEVLTVLHGDARPERHGSSPRAQLAALLMRLANAMHVAPALGYGMPSAAGAMLRVRA